MSLWQVCGCDWQRFSCECDTNQYLQNRTVCNSQVHSCPDGTVPREEKDGCVECDKDEYAFDGKCLPVASTSSAEDAIGGVFANEALHSILVVPPRGGLGVDGILH